MKKITRRAFSVLLLAALVIFGLAVYVLRYVDHGEDWAMYFSRLNSANSGEITDRNGAILASFDANGNAFAPDAFTRTANYHVTGDFWNRTGTGLLSNFWSAAHGYSLLTGTTRTENTRLRLAIDAGLNNTAYNELAGRKGTVLVVNYKTGELVCMVSSPSVDPADAEAPAPDGAYINRGLSASFVPGSVFKLVTAAAAIENLSDLDTRTFYCDGHTDFAGVEITCTGSHGTQTFEEALANSCNVAFSQLAVQLGQSTMIRYVRQYGFLDNHELDSIRTAAGAYPLDFVGDPEIGWSGIGQSTDLVNPFAMLRFVSAVGNGGILCEPSMILDGKAPEKERFMEAATAEKLRQMMSYNVAAHYASSVDFSGMRLCAKTGTAEVGDGTTHAWFTGFLDDEEHPYAFVVMIENGGGGLAQAAPVARAVLKHAMQIT